MDQVPQDSPQADSSPGGSSGPSGIPPSPALQRDPVYILPRVPAVVGTDGAHRPSQTQSAGKSAAPSALKYPAEGEPPLRAQWSMNSGLSYPVQSSMNCGFPNHLQYSMNSGVSAPLQTPHPTYPYIGGQEYMPALSGWPPFTAPARAWPPLQYQPPPVYAGSMYPTLPPGQLPLSFHNTSGQYQAQHNAGNATDSARPFNNTPPTFQLPNIATATNGARYFEGTVINLTQPFRGAALTSKFPNFANLSLREGGDHSMTPEALNEYLKCRMPVMSQAPHTSATNRPEGFITVVPRKLFISRPVKWRWSFTVARLREMVRRSIERKYMIDHDPIPAEMFQTPIEHIEVPRRPNGSYKGYAVITFKSINAAYVAFKALTFEEYFHVRLDIFQQDIPIRHVETKLYAAGFPLNFTKDFTLGLVESCIPSTLGRLTHDGVLIHDCVLAFDFPTNPDGTCEGHACITFGFEEVANTVRAALYYRGFLVSFSPIPPTKHGLAGVPVVNEPPPCQTRDPRRPYIFRYPHPQMGIFPETPPEIAHPPPCLSDKQSAQMIAKRARRKAVQSPPKFRTMAYYKGTIPEQRRIDSSSMMKSPTGIQNIGLRKPDPNPAGPCLPHDNPDASSHDPGSELPSPMDLTFMASEEKLVRRQRTMSL